MESGVLASRICKQLMDVFTEPITSPAALSILVDEIASVAKRRGKIFLFGVGREGLMLKAFCMRLYHLGLQAHCVLDMNTPPCGAQDLLVASAGPGGHSTIDAMCRRARNCNARVLLLTAVPRDGSAVPLASVVAHIPAQTMANDRQSDLGLSIPELLPMGSLYELALFAVCEMAIFKLAETLNQSPEKIRGRHTNLE